MACVFAGTSVTVTTKPVFETVVEAAMAVSSGLLHIMTFLPDV